MAEPADIKTAVQLNEQLRKILSSKSAGVEPSEKWPDYLPVKPVMDGGVKFAVIGKDNRVEEYTLALKKSAGGQYDTFTLLNQEQVEKLFGKATADKSRSTEASVRVPVAALENNPLIALQPEETAFALPVTALKATTLAELALVDNARSMGGVSMALAAQGRNDEEIEARKQTLDISYSQTSAEMIALRDDFMRYYSVSTTAEQKLELEQGMIARVNAMPDGYKPVAVAFVRDTLARGQALPEDVYQKQIAAIYMDENNVLAAQRALYPAQFPAPARTRPAAAPPMAEDFREAAAPQTEAPAANLKLPEPMPASTVEAEIAHYSVAVRLADALRLQRISGADATPLIEQFKARDALYPEDQHFGPMLQRALTELGLDVRGELFDAGRVRLQAERDAEALARRATLYAESRAPYVEAELKALDQMRVALAGAQAELVKIMDPNNPACDTLCTGADLKQAREIYGVDMSRQDMMKAVGFAPVGEGITTIKMGDGGTYALWELQAGKNDHDYVLRTPGQLQLAWATSYRDRALEIAENGGMTLSSMKGFGAFSHHIERTSTHIETHGAQFDITKNARTELSPQMQAAVLRYEGKEAEAERLEEELRRRLLEAENKIAVPEAVGPA